MILSWFLDFENFCPLHNRLQIKLTLKPLIVQYGPLRYLHGTQNENNF